MAVPSLAPFSRGAFALLSCFASLLVVPASRADLLYEYHQGGPLEYRDAGNRFTAEFDVMEPIRVQGIFGWFNGGEGLVDVSISGLTEGAALGGSASFQLRVVPAEGTHQPPGDWMGTFGLAWDLQPGTYRLEFLGGAMPLAYGYHGPIADVGTFVNFERFWNDEFVEGAPFGARIYGRELAAVPEPATYGGAAALVLLGVAIARRRRQLRPNG